MKFLLSALFVVICIAPANAELLTIANTPNGGLTVSANLFDFFLPNVNGFGDFTTGGGTLVAYSGGVLTSATNPYGRVLDITPTSSAVSNFIQFYIGSSLPLGSGPLQTFPVFDLVSVLPGGSAQGALNNCAGVTAVGVACSPFISAAISPLVLTNRGAYTDVSFGVSLNEKDATGTNPWSGGFTGQVVGQTPAAIQNLLSSGGSVFFTYSATFAPTGGGDVVPEPGFALLVGTALVVVALRKRLG